VRQDDGRFRVPEMQLLYARSLEADGRFDEAKAAYAVAAEVCPGEEARCRQALLLRRAGDPEAALALFQSIVRSVAKADPAYLRTQRMVRDRQAGAGGIGADPLRRVIDRCVPRRPQMNADEHG
jgi:hypothetical protein